MLVHWSRMAATHITKSTTSSSQPHDEFGTSARIKQLSVVSQFSINHQNQLDNLSLSKHQKLGKLLDLWQLRISGIAIQTNQASSASFCLCEQGSHSLSCKRHKQNGPFHDVLVKNIHKSKVKMLNLKKGFIELNWTSPEPSGPTFFHFRLSAWITQHPVELLHQRSSGMDQIWLHLAESCPRTRGEKITC